MNDRINNLRDELKSTKTIAANWEIFERETLPATATDAQRRDMRVAFYGGCAVLYDMLMRAADVDDDSAGTRLLSAIDRELRDFAMNVVAKALLAEMVRPGESIMVDAAKTH